MIQAQGQPASPPPSRAWGRRGTGQGLQVRAFVRLICETKSQEDGLQKRTRKFGIEILGRRARISIPNFQRHILRLIAAKGIDKRI